MNPDGKQIFLDAFHESVGPTLDPRDKLQIDIVASGHLETLTTIRTGYFAFEDLPAISSEAGHRLATIYLQQNPKDLNLAWKKIAEDFHTQNFWGFKPQSERPVKVKKKNELTGFLWILFQAAIMMKLVVLYFGTNAADLDSDWHYVGLGIALLFSFGTLFYFAYRKSKTYKD